MRRTLLTAAALLAACAASKPAQKPAEPPATARRLAWVVHPDAEVASASDAHAFKGAPLCQRCHASPRGKLVVEEATLCYQCHHAAKMTHVGKIQSPPPKTLPYEEGGRIVCHTCHEVHDIKAQPYGFRGPMMAACLECHQRH